MRTQDEIISRIVTLGDVGDIFRYEAGDLIACLPFLDAKPWLNKDAASEDWVVESAAPEDVLARLKDYMPFAWDKANNCRGLSAGRSLCHMSAWLWLLGEDDASAALAGYDRYGKPQLAAICEHYGIDWRELDDGMWVNYEDGDHLGVEIATLPFRNASEKQPAP